MLRKRPTATLLCFLQATGNRFGGSWSKPYSVFVPTARRWGTVRDCFAQIRYFCFGVLPRVLFSFTHIDAPERASFSRLPGQKNLLGFASVSVSVLGPDLRPMSGFGPPKGRDFSDPSCQKKTNKQHTKHGRGGNGCLKRTMVDKNGTSSAVIMREPSNGVFFPLFFFSTLAPLVSS